MWEISNLSQLSGLLYSVIMGVIFGFLYDVLRALRIVKTFKNITVFFQDVFYFVIIANITFIFFLAVTKGEIRLYILIGILVGFLSYFFTLSRLFTKLLKLLFSKTFNLFSLLFNVFYRIFDLCDRKITDFLKNMRKCLKKVLKKGKELVYTNRK